jgi:hypothetical protein
LSAACVVASCGCGRGELPTREVFGTVTCNGEKVPEGEIRFVPIEGTPGPVSSAAIVDGQYRIEARGGVPVGEHRVEVRAMRKTGRKVARQVFAGETAMVDETVPLGAAGYDGVDSPLVEEVTAGGDGRIDVEIPKANE